MEFCFRSDVVFLRFLWMEAGRIPYEYSNLRVLEDGPYDEMLVSCFQGIDMGPGLTMIMTSRYT